MVDGRIKDLVQGFLTSGWKSEPMEKALAIAAATPDAVGALANTVMERVPKGGTFLDAALLFLPEDLWPAVVRDAVRVAVADPANEAAESVVAYASLQCPAAVHPFLPELFGLDERYKPYYGTYAWREARGTQLDFLVGKLSEDPANTPPDAERYRAAYGDTRFRAFEALLETRDPRALTEASAAASGLGLPEDRLRYHLWQVDWELHDERFRQLTPELVYHIQFPHGYVERPGFLRDWPLPTWQAADPGTAACRFGGTLDAPCGVCGEPLHHLFTLPQPFAAELGVRSVPCVALTTCLSCLGWEAEPLFYAHDGSGEPSALAVAARRAPDSVSPPFEEARVEVVPTPARWRWQDWGLSNGRENLHRLGGHPCWIQSAEYPMCRGCGRTMPFLLQLDSELRLADGDSHLWGSGGICYVFWCDSCRLSATTIQQT